MCVAAQFNLFCTARICCRIMHGYFSDTDLTGGPPGEFATHAFSRSFHDLAPVHLRHSCSSIRRSLHRMGWRWARPRLAPARNPDPEAPAKLAALAQAKEQAQQGQAHLLYLDESDLPLLPLIRSLWMRMPAPTHPDPWHHPPSRGLWGPGCKERAVVLSRPRAQVGRPWCRFSPAARSGLPQRHAVPGAGPCPDPSRQGRAALARGSPTGAGPLVAQVCGARGEPG